MSQVLHLEIDGSGPPLVMLHGWGWHSSVWQPVRAALAAHFQLFLIDLPGFGKSPVLTNRYLAADCVELILNQVPPKATWLGWSLGGLLAWWGALHYPNQIARLITVATTPCFVAQDHWPGVPLATWEKFAASLSENYEQTILDFLDLQLRGSLVSPTTQHLLQQQIFSVPKPPLSALLGGLNLLRTIDLREQLASIKIPSLHLLGSHDTLVPARIAPLVKALSPRADCNIIQRSGHMPFLVQPNVFVSHIVAHALI